MTMPAWLPAPLTETDLIRLELLAWAAYNHSFKPGQQMPRFKVGFVSVEREPHVARPDREHSYWHVVTQGKPESARTFSVKERMERIPWLRPFIENWGECKVWWEWRDDSKHWNLWHASAGHVVIVKETNTGYLLKTAYPVELSKLHSWIRKFAEAKKTGRV